MFSRLMALFVSFLLFLLGVQSIDLTRSRSLPSPSDVDFPEVDGSAVDDICKIFPETPEPIATINTITTTTSLVTKKAVVTNAKPAVQTPRRKPETKNTGTGGRITNTLNNRAANILYYLLVNSRRRVSLPGQATLVRRAGRTYGNRWNIGSSSSEDSSDES